MNKLSLYCILLLSLFCGLATSCSEFEPTGYKEIPDLPKVSDLKAVPDGYTLNLSWTLPAREGIEGVRVIINGDNDHAVELKGKVSSYEVIGQPMGEESLYTVKVLYEGGYMSEGTSVSAELPHVDLPKASDVAASVSGRTVTLSWTLPDAPDITGVKIIRDGDEKSATLFTGSDVTSCVLKGQPMDKEITYSVAVVYAGYYDSEGVPVKIKIPYITPKMGFVMLAPSVAQLPDDDERAAAEWFVTQPNAELIIPSQLASLDPDIYAVLWIMVDREGLPAGWQNLPAEISGEEAIKALRAYSANGGSLYLSNMATQLTVPLGIVPEYMAPNIFANGAGGVGSDVWTINPYLGWMFREGGDQGFYDRTDHAIFKGLSFEDPNGYGYPSLPLIGPGQREDHNCMWDCNQYDSNQIDVIKNFEVITNSLVLATWGHVRDHCVAGIVDFFANAEHGRCVANGFAAYEWSQNSGPNPYQHNIEQLTANILDYLK